MRRVSFGPFDSLFFLVLSVHLVLWSRCFAVRLDWPTTEADQRERGGGGQGSGREHLEDASFIQTYPLLKINPTKGQPNQ